MGPELCHFRASLAYDARGLASRGLLSEQGLKDVSIWLVHIPAAGTFLQVLLLPHTKAVLHGGCGSVR